MIANLAVGASYFIKFAESIEAVEPRETEAMRCRIHDGLDRAAATQGTHLVAADPVPRFIELLSSAIVCGRAHLASPIGDTPVGPEAWGWRNDAGGVAEFDRAHRRPLGERIGWTDRTNIYLDPQGAYRAVIGMSSSAGDGLCLSERMLWKRLAERGLLASTDSARQTFKVRRRLQGCRRSVLHLNVDTVFGVENPSNSTAFPRGADLTGARASMGSGNGSSEGRVGADATTRSDRENRPETAATEQTPTEPVRPSSASI